MGSEKPEAQPFEIHTTGPHFVKIHLKSGQKFPDLEWSFFQMIGTIAIVSLHLNPGMHGIRAVVMYASCFFHLNTGLDLEWHPNRAPFAI